MLLHGGGTPEAVNGEAALTSMAPPTAAGNGESYGRRGEASALLKARYCRRLLSLSPGSCG
jgi:hypothetical protein